MLKFDENTHTYELDGKKLISTTQLLRKNNLAPNYDMVDEEVLKKAAEKGTLIHSEIEEFIKTGSIGFTNEVALFIDWYRKQAVSEIESEIKVYNDIVAGTIDLIYKRNNEWWISDIKTTSTIHTSSVQWQLSIYKALAEERLGIKIERSSVLHIRDVLKEKELSFINDDEVNKLFECERAGIIYAPYTEIAEMSALVEVENQIKEFLK